MGDIAAMFVVVERLFDLADAVGARSRRPRCPRPARLALFDEVAVAVRSADRRSAARDQAGHQPRRGAGAAGQGRQRARPPDQAVAARGSLRRRARGSRPTCRRRARRRRWRKKVVRLFELDGAVGLADLGARDRDRRDRADPRVHASGPGARARLGAGQCRADRVERSVGTAADRGPGARFPAAAARIPRTRRRQGSRRRGRRMARRRMPAASRSSRAWSIARGTAAAPNAAMLAQIAGQARVLLGR